MKSYIISLSKIESSITSAIRLKSSLEQFGMEAELFEGTYGNVAREQYIEQKRQWHPWGFKGPTQPYPESFRKEIPPPGEIGCFFSHYRLWKLCAESKQSIIIFEDDVVLTRPYIPVVWDDVLSLAFSHAKKMLRYQHYLDAPEGPPSAVHYKPASMPGNGGYAIHPHAAQKLIDAYENTYLPADNAINHYIVKIQIHNYMMGRAPSKHEGNISLIKTRIWENTDK
jgi:GR25 family glycosyltransferase involved in LPS biosynthesis